MYNVDVVVQVVQEESASHECSIIRTIPLPATPSVHYATYVEPAKAEDNHINVVVGGRKDIVITFHRPLARKRAQLKYCHHVSSPPCEKTCSIKILSSPFIAPVRENVLD